MINAAWWLNTVWMLSCRKASRAFHAALMDVAATQWKLLRATLAANAETDFGREHKFRDIRSVADFQARVPVRTYEQLSPWIERVADGEDKVLTAEQVLLFQPTSGSSSAEKLIPYTTSLRRQFQSGIQAWIYDLFSTHPEVRNGRAYWSISPAFGTRRFTSGGIPIGFDNDEAYLSGLEQLLVRRLLVMPSAVSKLTSGDTFRYVTLLHLLAARDLSLISVWSPTFLTGLVSNLLDWSERLIRDLQRGTLSETFAEPIANALRADLAPRSNPRRAGELREIFRSCPRHEWAAAIWPQLKLISCWTDASAGMYLPEMRSFFPQPELQPKGLIATEAFATFPSHALSGRALAITSHFCEFVPAGPETTEQSPLLAQELEAGGVYRLLVTTAGGLYRYDLGDLVEVTGHAQGCPLLRFLGRAGGVSDLVGEKLSESFVSQSLEDVFDRFDFVPRFALLAPARRSPAYYRLYLQLERNPPPKVVMRCQEELEDALRKNPYYRHAIEIRQLAPVQIELLDSGGPPAWQAYEAHCSARGQTTGNMKPRVLDNSSEWELIFAELQRSQGVRTTISV